MIDQVAIVLEPCIGREELDVLLGENSANEVAEEGTAVKLLGAPEENVLGFERVGEDDPGEGTGLDEGLHDGRVMPRGEGRKPALWMYFEISVCTLDINHGACMSLQLSRKQNYPVTVKVKKE